MKTQIIPMSESNIQSEGLAPALECLRSEGLVVFPTETVYGLGAHGLVTEAVEKIFIAKGRPADNPLILHIASMDMLEQVARDYEKYLGLLKAFWPGPLTVVLPKKDIVPDVVTAGLDTVAVRWPSGKIARALIEAAGFPLAAPSANRSGRPSPTTAQMAFHDLEGRVPFIIDGGPCELGLESTVVDLSGDVQRILRPGALTYEDLLPFLPVLQGDTKKNEPLRSPGMKYRHYKPDIKIIVFDEVSEIGPLVERHQAGKPMVLGLGKGDGLSPFIQFNDYADFAQRLYSVFFELERTGCDLVLIQRPEERGLGRALLNRILKASDII
ncbi:MAG: threonylcarbamoyl-AMP synthase, partial [Spirochaetae bacterium HGW-Spirochaetae-6]